MLSLPGYKILSCIYTGTSSNLYKGLRESDNKAVVIKTSTQQILTEKKTDRFQSEFAIGQQIDSPYVVRYLELKQDPAYGAALIMADDNAVDLSSVIPPQGFSNQEFLEIAIQIVQGLQAIHTANIIHNDLELSNIIIQQATKTVKIIDFDQASTVQQVMQPAVSTMTRSLAYISPEQTGRINRNVDYRTDFYSLGVTFYRLLCGQLPFTAEDALTLIHQHLAKQSQPPHIYKPTIALSLSKIVMKLLEKEAENRYQSCEGLLHDLRYCLSTLHENGFIPDFELGQQDFSSTLILSQHLYGRENEIQILQRAFECISSGGREVVMVTGQAGIGKSMLIQEIRKPIALKQGYFLAGKFDQLNKNVAYSALTQAFNSFINQLLTEDEASILQWKNRILAALSTHAPLIVKVVPSLALLIGEQPVATIVDINQAKNIFNLVFLEFVSTLANAAHPLVIFLDDLQWADNASLELMVYLMQQPKVNHLLWIGAYRDNEVTLFHPAMQAIAELQGAKVNLQTLKLEPLLLEHLCQWIAESLHMPLEEVSTFAELIQIKTAGNPFFVKRFLHSLYTEQLLYFSKQKRSWQWNLKEIRRHPATENVLTLMSHEIQQLPYTTQEALKIASCLGHRLMLKVIQTAIACSLDELYSRLQPALESGVIVQTDTEIYFAHDRIQEAAYHLLTEAEKSQAHLTIGKRLLAHLPTEEDWLFDIAVQFNHCRELICEPSERRQIARLNLEAGEKAKAATAYFSALNYFYDSLAWTDKKTLWLTDYSFAFTLHKELAEMEYLCGHVDISQDIIAKIQPYLQSTLDKVEIYHLLIIQKIILGQQQEAITLGHEVLQLLGSRLPIEDPKGFVQNEMPLLKQKLAGIRPLSFLDKPLVVEPEKQAIIKILADLSSVCYQLGSELLPAITIMFTNMSLNASCA